jgi:amidohydrolase
VRDVAEFLFGESAVHWIPVPSMGSEDFAHYLQHVPGALIRIGTANGPDTRHPLHDNRFDIDEAALAPAARLMAHALIRHLNNDVSS